MSDPKSDSKPKSLIVRGEKSPSTTGKTIFTVLRGLDPFLQYALLRPGGLGSVFLTKIGLNALPASPAAQTGITALDALGLSPHSLILVAMATGCALKQIYHLNFLSYEGLNPSASVMVSAFNSTVGSINSLLYLCPPISSANSPAISFSLGGSTYNAPITLLLGGVMFATGIILETVSELQRRKFKEDPANKGRPCTTGFWGITRHINYTGYTLWRGGYALAAGGFAWGAVTVAWFLYYFKTSAIPELDEYCSERYGEQWKAYKRQTKAILVPGLC